MPKPRVYSKRDKRVPEQAVYVGRPTKFGNPFEIGVDGTRSEVIRKYKAWLRTQPELIAAIRKELAGKDLVCWCAPKACHADVILQVANTRCLLDQTTQQSRKS